MGISQHELPTENVERVHDKSAVLEPDRDTVVVWILLAAARSDSHGCWRRFRGQIDFAPHTSCLFRAPCSKASNSVHSIRDTPMHAHQQRRQRRSLCDFNLVNIARPSCPVMPQSILSLPIHLFTSLHQILFIQPFRQLRGVMQLVQGQMWISHARKPGRARAHKAIVVQGFP